MIDQSIDDCLKLLNFEFFSYNENIKEDHRLPMILNNNNAQLNRPLNIEGNRIANIIKNSINDLQNIKNSERSNKIKELTKLYRVGKSNNL